LDGGCKLCAFVDIAQAQTQYFGVVWFGSVELRTAIAAKALGAFVAAGSRFDVIELVRKVVFVLLAFAPEAYNL